MSVRRLLLLAVLLLGAVSAAPGQRVRVEATLEASTNKPRVRVFNLFDDAQWREAIAASYPVRLNYTLELWRARTVFSENMITRKWAFVISRQAVLDVYTLTTLVPGQEPRIERFASLDDLRMRIELPVPISGVGPTRSGTFWYELKLGISTLSADEFDDLQHYLQGGNGSGGGGLATTLLRWALPKETVVAETPRFVIGNR